MVRVALVVAVVVLCMVCGSEAWSGTGCLEMVQEIDQVWPSIGRECLMLCGMCSTGALRLAMDATDADMYCKPAVRFCDNTTIPSPNTAAKVLTNAVVNASALQGWYWNEPENASACLQHLITYMPRRDLLLLFSEPFSFMAFLNEHVRYALHTRSTWPDVPWDVFLDYVLPYAVLDEQRDLKYRWRPRYHRLFFDAVGANASQGVLAAAHTLVSLIPTAYPQGVLELGTTAMPDQPITWHSETSPGMLSPDQVGAFGGSCTGTAIVLALAARSVGLPVRVTGCSQSVPNDDHHWVEFYDPTVDSPFGDGWHTKEGVSKGNAGGPWDSPSGPMNGCLKYLLPHDELNTIWATSWSSASFLPLQWSRDNPYTETWQFKGGINRCGAYCTAWGCGKQQSEKYSQAQCAPS